MSTAKAKPTRSGSPQPLGVYIHFPWCRSKCPYCDFASSAVDPAAIMHRAYADALMAEWAQRRSLLQNYSLCTIFVGGGTPSLWAAEQLERVLSAICADLVSDPAGIEITVECNPGSLTAGTARELRAAGANRLSIGLQSLDAERLRFLGRMHGPKDGLQAIDAALAAGFDNVAVDLMLGVPGQQPWDAEAEAVSLIQTGITHLSAYMLTIEPDTAFGAQARRGELAPAAEEDAARSFTGVSDALTMAGWSHYEISNYARDGRTARHNIGYWLGHDYVGLGCAAWGTLARGDERIRYHNTPSPDRYLRVAPVWTNADLTRPSDLTPHIERVDPSTALSERIMLGLRLAKGVDVAAHALALGVPAWPAERQRAVQRLTASGRLVREGSRLRIPREQWLFADATIAELL